MSVYFLCDHLKVCWREITAKEGENRFDKRELSEGYNFFIIFPPQPPPNPSIGNSSIAPLSIYQSLEVFQRTILK
jgi:hypothetical protein